MPDFVRFKPIPILGAEDESGTYQVFDEPEYALIVEILGSDSLLHLASARIGHSSTTYPEVLENMYRMLENLLKNRMIKQGVWGA